MDEKVIEEYSCWPVGYSEGEAKIIKADSPKDAAWMAVDAWRHEGFLDFRMPELVVNVKDSNNMIHKVYVNQETYLDSSGPVV